MSSESSSLVSIVTPVYNNADNFAECIESIQAQTYQNWKLIIVNNCSTDGSAEIAQQYAAKDSRIRVHNNERFLRAIPNHNFALRQIAPESKYCKIVFADDWIFPNCLEQMVAVAEEHPSVGIVGAYGLEECGIGSARRHEVAWLGLSYPSRRICGREVCRSYFLEGTYVFGTATSLLFRADLVRSCCPFYNESNLHADMETCILLLKRCDFGFVHQVLTFKRWRPESLGTITADFNTMVTGHLHNLVAHGSDFLTQEEFARCLRGRLSEYYNFLAVSFLRGRRDKKFWNLHERKLHEMVGFSRTHLARAILRRLGRAMLNPYETLAKLREQRRARQCADGKEFEKNEHAVRLSSIRSEVQATRE
jgi:glycosyltransferase involved in cell wall biosynthesis